MGNGSSNTRHPGGSLAAYNDLSLSSNPQQQTPEEIDKNKLKIHERIKELQDMRVQAQKNQTEKRMNSMIEELTKNGYKCEKIEKTTGGKRRVKKRATRKRKTRA
jgi:hypothetical protein